MAIRTCPSCLTVVSAGKVVAFSNDLTCPGCQRPLEISPVSRDLSVAAGLAAAVAGWDWTTKLQGNGMLGWVLPVLYAFFAFSIVAPLVLMATADLRIRDASPAPAQWPAEAAHGADHDAPNAHH